MNLAVKSVVSGTVSVRGSAALFKLPYFTLKDRVNISKFDFPMEEKKPYRPADHPTAFSPEEELDFTTRLKDLAARGFGCTPEQIRRAAFTYATTINIKHPWDMENMIPGRD
ncbi:hypothetical protein ANN_01338 [Periplaneta americana]|uniref:Uncharacterized protein n=1 Tax=Periplaneta americana TaxID=6978 RepID=A0ABQ8TUY1_PERAM|nr:hypothetical protein ANN_01338 [Periplaneta americana]